MVAFVAAPVGAMLTHGDYDFAQAVVFLLACLSPYMGLMPTPAIGTSLSGNPDPLDWDGPLWTLTWEALCYIVVALLVFSARRLPESRAAILATSFLFASVTGGIAVKLLQGGFGPGRADFALPLMAFFLAGSVLAHLRERVQTGALPFALALATAWLSLASSWAPILIPLPLTYIVLSLGSLRTLSRIGSRFDISYGVYIYGWPVQQLLAGMHLPALLPPLGYAAVALVAVWPLAFLSCVLVEQPAQRMRKSWTQRRSILV
jgi:peptidoglycan/LPS O-acetylase OafA/YrhL